MARSDMIHDPDEYPSHKNLPSQKERIERKEWDTLIVFDACRWDALNQVIDESVEKLRSPTSHSTVGWMKHIWSQNMWDDVTYVSGNPMTDWVQTEESEEDGYNIDLNFKEYIRTWKDSGAHHQYSPVNITRIADNRDPPIVIHYMQPHTPFIGDIKLDVTNYEWMGETTTSTSEYKLVETGHASPELIRRAYIDNLKFVLQYARRFQNRPGKTVFTADHGEVLGPDQWSHGGGDRRARVVPWIEYG